MVAVYISILVFVTLVVGFLLGVVYTSKYLSDEYDKKDI
jgi:hypothetical protein|nr:MAG TPA: STEM CELL FACTOR, PENTAETHYLENE GLYCOL STEM CELL FACTOR, STEEL [Caudoviricetes sp.]